MAKRGRKKLDKRAVKNVLLMVDTARKWGYFELRRPWSGTKLGSICREAGSMGVASRQGCYRFSGWGAHRKSAGASPAAISVAELVVSDVSPPPEPVEKGRQAWLGMLLCLISATVVIASALLILSAVVIGGSLPKPGERELAAETAPVAGGVVPALRSPAQP